MFFEHQLDLYGKLAYVSYAILDSLTFITEIYTAPLQGYYLEIYTLHT